MRYYRIHANRPNDSEFLQMEHKSVLWTGHDDDATRSGLSCCASYEDLVNYFYGRGANVDGAYLIIMEGEENDETPYEEEYGERLITPTTIVSCTPIEDTEFIADVCDWSGKTDSWRYQEGLDRIEYLGKGNWRHYEFEEDDEDDEDGGEWIDRGPHIVMY